MCTRSSSMRKKISCNFSYIINLDESNSAKFSKKKCAFYKEGSRMTCKISDKKIIWLKKLFIP